MDRPVPVLMAVAALAAFGALAIAVAGRATGTPAPPRASAAGAGTYRFDAGVTPLNRNAWLLATGRARPEARRLFDRVDGLVTVVDGPAPAGALGVTEARGGRYTIRFRFGAVFQALGQRGFDRLVHHELAHVVDDVLLDPALRRALDAGIPPGRPCPAGTRSGSCAPGPERFAESFAKWATGDLGIDLYAGYAVPPPPDLEAWGRPLAELAAS